MNITPDGKVAVDGRQISPQALEELLRRAGVSPEEIKGKEPIVFLVKMEPIED